MKTKLSCRPALVCISVFILALGMSGHIATAGTFFIHPGGLNTQQDFDRMKAKVGANVSPWVDSYDQLIALSEANLGWPWDPVGQIVRGAAPNNYARSQKDALAIYYLALRYQITGDTNYANYAIQGMNAWSSTMTNGVGGNSNYALGAGICGYEFACAGEALRGYPGWSQSSMNAYSNFLMIFYGSCNYFLSGHNGTCDSHYWCNWDACNLAAIMAIGVFCDNTNIFNQAVSYLETGIGNGNLTSAAWYVHTNGLAQWQESGRDQAHTVDGLDWLGVACQIAWNQGVDLYGYDNNRYLRGLEYVAKYNLGNDVPYVPLATCDSTEYTGVISSGGRGGFPPFWDMFYNHYVNVKGLSAPYTAQAAALLRPDGFYNNPNSPDFMGFTTLTCLLDPIADGAAPSGLTANVSGKVVTLTWWGSAYATNYNIKRGTVSGGPYTTIGIVSSAADRMFADTTATNGGPYYYVITALDKFGESANSPEKRVSLLTQLSTYYKFDETAGTTAGDSSGLSPSAALVNGAAFATGRYGNAVNLDGNSQYVALPPGLITGLGDFTIATWVYLNSVNTWTRIFDFGADTDRYMFLTPFSGSGTVRFAITKFGGNGEQQINSTAPLTAGWHHLAVTLKGTDGSGVGVLYVDGVPVGTNSSMFYTPNMIGSLVNATNNFIGRSQFAGDPYLNGKVDDFRIYNGALTAAQIAALYSGAPPLAPAAPAKITSQAISASSIEISWMAVDGATDYQVQRSLTQGGPYTVVASGITATNYTDTGLSGNTTYYYVVTPVNDGGLGTNSLETSATTLTPPPAPTHLTATGLYGGQIVLAWDASGGAASYNIKRSMNSGGPYATVATGVTLTSWTNNNLAFDATYYYVVSAVNDNGESLDSGEASSAVPVPILIWTGNASTSWDIAQTTNWLFAGAPSTYFADGAAVLFDDTAASSSVNLSAPVAPYSVTFSNSSLNYTVNSANGSGIGGAATLTKLGTGTTTLNTTNTFTGDININGGGTLAIAGGGQLGGGNYSGNIVNYGTLNYGSSASQTLSGTISMSGALSKTGSGTLTLTKPNHYTGATAVSTGWLLLSDYGGILNSGAILIGNSSGGSAALWQSGDDTVVAPTAVLGALQIGSTPGGYGYYSFASGTLSLAGEMDIGGSSGGAGTFGQFDMSGGNVVMPDSTSSYFLPNRGGAGESSVVNIAGGIVGISGNGTPVATGANGFTVNWSGSGAAQTNTTTISGGGEFLIPSLNANLNYGGNSANVASLNLNGGLMQVLGIPAAAGAARINFNGGTLKAGNSGGVFINGSQAAMVYSNGATIDDNGQSIVIEEALQAPGGYGVSSITIASGGAGYVMPPQVFITGGGGSNATAYATIGEGAVTGIVVTCAGAGYSSMPTVRLVGGGFTTAAVTGAATIAPNISGGLTKLGIGTLTLDNSNSYGGPTIISSGTLRLGGPLLYLSFDSTNGKTVINQGNGGTAMNGTLTGTNVLIVSGGHSGNALLVSNGPVNTGYVLINSPVANFNNSGTWTWGMWIKTSTAGGAYMYQGSGGWGSGNTSFYLNSGGTSSGAKGGGVRWGQGWQEGVTSVNDGRWHYIAMTCNYGSKVFYVDGVADSWAANSWSGNGTGSQLWIGGTADTGDGNTPFNGLIDDVSIFGRALSQSDITNWMNGIKSPSPALPANADVVVGASASLILDTTAQTIGALSGSNSSSIQLGGETSTAFTFGNASNTVFAGSINGNGSVTKNGSGTVTLSGVNTYNGATIINSGTVTFGQSDNTNYVTSLGPVAWYNFDQGVGNGVITNLGSGGEAMNAIMNGNASITNNGRYGNALYLDGASYLEIDNKVTPLDCNATSASWTYALWIKTGTAGAIFGYQGDGTWSSDATTFYLNSNGTSAGTKAGGVRWGDGWLTGTTSLNNNAWHFVAITASGGVKTIYVDGRLDAQTGTTGWTAPAMTSANQFLIGSSPDTGDGGVPFTGLIDEVYLFNRALSLTEVQNIMANRSVEPMGTVAGQLPAASPVSLGAAATLDLAGTTQSIASLSDIGSGGGLVANGIGTPAALVLNESGSNAFSGSIHDASLAAAINLVENGSGTQVLSGTFSTHGSVTVSNGTLLVTGSLNADNVDVSGGTLGGNGDIGTVISVDANGVLWPSASGPLGQLTCANNLRLAGTTFMEINQAMATNDSVAVSGTLNYGGTLIVTNLAGALVNGDSFRLFTAANTTSSFVSTQFPALSTGLRWDWNSSEGLLSVVPATALNPTNLSYVVSNHVLTLSWPADHLGWRLLAQTNAGSLGLGTNWVTVENSTNVNQVSLPIATDYGSVFYRLIYP